MLEERELEIAAGLDTQFAKLQAALGAARGGDGGRRGRAHRA